jgi:hypothetical protein
MLSSQETMEEGHGPATDRDRADGSVSSNSSLVLALFDAEGDDCAA